VRFAQLPIDFHLRLFGIIGAVPCGWLAFRKRDYPQESSPDYLSLTAAITLR
jgi:hypothetical protein